MTTPPASDTDHDRIAAEAVDLVVSLMSGAATAADAARIRAWRSQSSAHEGAFADAMQTWRGLREAARAAASLPVSRREHPALNADARLPRRLFLIGGASAATAAAVVAAVRPPLDLWPSLSEFSADYRTAKGERRTVNLLPEVRLDLNTLTSLALRATSGDPDVELIAGEALVESRLGPGRHVSIIALDGAATVSDARFNLRCVDGVATVTCLEGAVDVRRGGRTTRLGPTQRLTYEPGGAGVTTVTDLKRAAAWTDGLLIFSDRPLASAVAEVNRYRAGRIMIVNPELGRRVVNGTFRIDRLASFVAQVEQLFGARATSLPGGLTVLS